MNYLWFVFGTAILDWFLFSVALFVISGKLGWKGKWKAWVPGIRIFALGCSVGMSKEGVFCGIMDFLFAVAMISKVFLTTGRIGTFASLAHLVLFIFLFIYKIQIYLQLLKLFDRGKHWVIWWFMGNWIPILILGISGKYQPDRDNIREDADGADDDEQDKVPDTLSESVPIVEEGLSVHLRQRTVRDFGLKRYLLKDIALNVPPKSMVLLLGGSGAGKTTLINAILGYEKADAKVLLNGVDVYNEYENVKHRIGFVSQQNLIRGKDTVIKTVRDAAKMRLPKSVSGKNQRKRVKEVMELLGLTTGQYGLVSQKSGGQLRRICIAMELVADPELFILDEPDSGLDGVIAREIFGKLRQIADEGRIVIVITHTPDRVIDLFDKVIVLGKDSKKVGRLAFYGSPDEARQFFGKETMEEIVMSLNGTGEGGEGRTDEFARNYIVYAASKEGGLVS